MKNNSQTIWVGLSFLVVGLTVGLILSSSSLMADVNILNAQAGEEEIPESNIPSIDPDSLQVVAVSVDDDAMKGDPNAPVTIVEFSDFQCPYCSKFYHDTLGTLTEKYIDTGLVNFVYRDFPLPSHAGAEPAAIAAECVRKVSSSDEKFFEMHDMLFESTDWVAAEDINTALISMGAELGVDITECMDDPDVKAEVQADYTAARGYGVGGTPSFFINGKMIVGAYPTEVFESIIESEL